MWGNEKKARLLLVPIRKWQRKKLFYLEMLIDGNKYAKNKSEALLPNTVFENLGTLFATFRDMQKSPIIRHFRTIYKNAFTLFFAKFLHP